MKIYKCDGETFYGKIKCSSEIEREEPNEWITIAGVVYNGLEDRKNISSGMELHFCSKKCLNNYLFKNSPDIEELILINEGFKFASNNLKVEKRVKRKQELGKYLKLKYEYCFTDVGGLMNSVFDYSDEEKEYIRESYDEDQDMTKVID